MTAQDKFGASLGLGTGINPSLPGGSFYACPAGNSSIDGELGENLSFAYPKNILGFVQDNTFFKTDCGKLQLLCHNKQAEADDAACYAYISLETVRDYMTKDGYFTNFSDNGSGIWSFEVRKPSVTITYPNNNTPSFSVGDVLMVKANIDKAVHAKLFVGQYTESKDTKLNQSEVEFSGYTLTNGDVGNLTLKVEVNTGGTAIGAETVTSAVQIQIDEPRDETLEIAPWLYGYKGRPVGTGDHISYSQAEWDKLKDIPNREGTPDWYSYENQSGPNTFVSPYLTGRTFNDQKYGEGELTDDKGRYWVTMGPKVFIPNYPDVGELKSEEFADHIGRRVDVVLYNDREEFYAYIECVWIGHIKAHTFNNGVFQTGHPYPNSVSATLEPYKVEYADGSIVEFTGAEPSTNGTMSRYRVVELIVYPN